MIEAKDFDDARQYIYNAIYIVNIASERIAELISRVQQENIKTGKNESNYIIADLINMNTEFNQLIETVQEVKRRLGELDMAMKIDVKEWRGKTNE